MKTNHTEITIVLDRSGSMAAVVSDTIGGFNRFLADQKAAPGTASITLHQFDTVFETVISGKDVKEAPELTTATFVPRGGTALLDAIGRGITDTGARIDAANEADRPSKVVFVIITDGEENSSREFRADKIQEMIKHQREKYSWEFVFLGANQDAIKAATNIGVAAASSMTYAHNAQGTIAAFGATSANLVSMRSGKSKDMTYSTKDREEQRKAGATL